MMIDPIDDLPGVEVSEARLDQMLDEIKQNSRLRRLALFAPLALAAAVMATLMAAPPRYGGLSLAEADAAENELPRVFGSNGVWRLAEPIAAEPAEVTADAGDSEVAAPAVPEAPAFVLSPPDPDDLSSLPTSTSTPPVSTSGQYPDAPEPATGEASEATDAAGDAFNPEDLDWSQFSAEIRTAPVEPADVDTDTTATDIVELDTGEVDTGEVDDATADPSTPDPLATAEDAAPPAPSSSDDEDVTVAVLPQAEPEDSEANPSTPPEDSSTVVTPPPSAVATITQQSVLVYSAHVSVTVRVVDGDSDVIDWCNTRVDWGDGTVTGVSDDADGVATCTASCEYEANPSALGIDAEIKFDHVYTEVIDAAPRIYVATGDGCRYTLAELHLDPFTVVPY